MLNRDKIIAISNYIQPIIILVLSLVSATDLCSGGCSSLSDYRLFGTHFAVAGSVYAVLLVAALYITSRTGKTPWVVDLLVAAGLGAEIYFIAIQKLVVKQWCPICLSIATVLVVFAALRSVQAYVGRRAAPPLLMSHEKWLLINTGKVAIVLLVVFVGFVTAVVSVGKKPVQMSNQAKALEAISQNQRPATINLTPFADADVWFGSTKSKFDVYFVSDWYCEFCRKTEPVVESMLPEVGKKARYTWIDLAIHRQSMNFIPYSLNALLNDKPNYLKVRKTLMRLAKEEKNITDDLIKSALRSAGIKALAPDKASLSLLFMDGTMFCRDIGVNITPSVIIVNNSTGARRILSGMDQISKQTVLDAISGENK